LTLLGTILTIGPAAIAGEGSMSSLVEGNNHFALELYGKLSDTPGNLFFSPNSISTALAMTYAGARGETAEQMSHVLHFERSHEKLHEAFAALRTQLRPQGEKPGFQLSVANRLWGQRGFHFLPDFLGITRDAYGAELAQVDFAEQADTARQSINQWVEERTQGKIRNLIQPGVLTPLTRLVLTNAIYFKGDWSRPFPKAATREEDFHVSTHEKIRIPLMHKFDDYRLAAVDGMKMLEIPYGNGELSALVLLPDRVDGMPELERKLGAESLRRWESSLAKRKVDVFLPRFKLTSQFSLGEVLSAMGMPLAFDRQKADFSGMSSEDELFISAVLHKAFVDVNEEGTEAAAATAVVMTVRAAIAPAQPAVFRADHPFLFLIKDRRSGSILFMGRVVNPTG
jgi:serpin B